jgi:hypothetical protein
MENSLPEVDKKKVRKWKIILWILFVGMFVPSFYFTIISGYPGRVGIYLFIFSFVVLALIIHLSKKYYNWLNWLFLFLFIGLFFRRNHLPFGAAIISISSFFICGYSLINSLRFLINFKHNTYLRWFGLTINIIITLFIFGFLIWAMHWSTQTGNFFVYSGSVLFPIAVLGMVFTLPNSNYVGWNSTDRKVFFRTIIIPMCIIFVLICLVLVFNDTFRILMDKDFSTVPWSNEGLKLFDLEGI